MKRISPVIRLLIVFVFGVNNALSQEGRQDSLDLKAHTGAIVSSESFLPFYLVNNQFGEIRDKDQVFVAADISYIRPLSNQIDLRTGFAFRNEILSAHFIGFGYNDLYLTVGREKRLLGGLINSLSSGSMAISANARPIPKVEIGLDKYVEVPFTKGYFKTKGHLAHGWLENDRHVVDAQLHSKSFYLMLDLTREIGFTASSGVVHFAQFGGTSPVWGEQPSSFRDYMRVFFGAGIPNPDGTSAGESNAVGNHLGIVETTVTKDIGNHKLTINYQKPFEDGGGIQYVSLTDYLFGLEWDLPERGKIVDKVYLEYIQTKWQGGPGLPDPNPEGGILTEEDNFGYPFGGRDDMYNNWIYRDGWTYNGRLIGNPLYLTYERTLNFFEPYPNYGVAITNNRLRAVHLGLEGNLGIIQYRGLFTYTSNFGTHTGLYEGRFNWNGVAADPDFEYVFKPALSQFYSSVELSSERLFADKPVGLSLRLALDTGDMYDALGAEIMLSYKLSKH